MIRCKGNIFLCSKRFKTYRDSFSTYYSQSLSLPYWVLLLPSHGDMVEVMVDMVAMEDTAEDGDGAANVVLQKIARWLKKKMI